MKWFNDIPKSAIIYVIGGLLVSIGLGWMTDFSTGCAVFGCFLLVIAYVMFIRR